MIHEIYDDIEWEIEEIPIGFSTPDEFYENSFRAYGTCDNGHKIEGTALYWSRDDDMSGAWLERVDYDECEECAEEDEDDEDEEN